jgi:hypothetical protein
MELTPVAGLETGFNALSLTNNVNSSDSRPQNLARDTLNRMLKWLEKKKSIYHTRYKNFLRDEPDIYNLLINCPPDNIWERFDNLGSIADLQLDRYVMGRSSEAVCSE